MRASSGSDLFTVALDASAELSDKGRKKVDAAMADFLESIRDSALIVEVYAGSGTSDEQFRRSLERAVKVREYLLKRFSLSAEYVRAMPMGAVRWNSPASAVQEPSRLSRLARSSACSSSIARIPSNIRRVVVSSLPR